MQKMDIGDKPGHAYAISQGKCTWIKPMTIAGIQTKEDIGTNNEEITATSSHSRGYVLGTWSFVNGTGKMKGVKGGGKFKGKPDADGSMVIEDEGEYTLPK